MSRPERIAFLNGLDDAEAALLLYDWRFWARAAQLPPDGPWRVWLILAGRGFGKTRTGAEWIRAGVESGAAGRVCLMGETAADVRDVMIEGESGLLAVAPPWNRPHYEPSKRRLTWPNGAAAVALSAEDPDQVRGHQFDAAWADEVASWPRPEAWHNLMLALRLGAEPRCVATTTPRPRDWLKALMEAPDTRTTRGHSQENADNLAPGYLAAMIRAYGGTRLGRQELEGAFLTDTPGALWQRAQLDACRIAPDRAPALRRVVVAVDPAASHHDGSNETGIVVAGLDAEGNAYVIEDLSGSFGPAEWATRVADAYGRHAADRVVAEVNQGGEMVAQVLRAAAPGLPIRQVRASRGKYARAEPVAALYERGRVRHAGGFPVLEDQMCAYTGGHGGGTSPDRLDALVWALTDLMLGPGRVESREFLF